MDLITYAAALKKGQKYTDESIEGISGSLAGKNCKIESIEPVEGGNVITFLWTADNGDERRDTLTVMNGEKGDKGLGIKETYINDEYHLIIVYDDDSEQDAGELPSGGGGTNNYNHLTNKPMIEGHTLQGNMTLEDIGDVAITNENIVSAVDTAFGIS